MMDSHSSIGTKSSTVFLSWFYMQSDYTAEDREQSLCQRIPRLEKWQTRKEVRALPLEELLMMTMLMMDSTLSNLYL